MIKYYKLKRIFWSGCMRDNTAKANGTTYCLFPYYDKFIHISQCYGAMSPGFLTIL